MAKKNLKKGVFITFEGSEGCGKTTQSKLLYEYLRKSGYGCVYTREPGGTRLGEKIRQILLHSKSIAISNLAEVFLFEAARAEIVNEVISPALKKCKIVICDRFSDATVAYQGYGSNAIPVETIKKLNKIATADLTPDLTILLDIKALFKIDAITGLRMANKKGRDRIEAKDVTYHTLVKFGYDKIAKQEPERIKIVRVLANKFETQLEIRKAVSEFIKNVPKT